MESYEHTRGKEDLLRPEATTERGACQVRSGTDHPCPRPAVVKICGVPFCERCAREQEAYFAVGELTQALAADRTKRTLDFRHITSRTPASVSVFASALLRQARLPKSLRVTPSPRLAPCTSSPVSRTSAMLEAVSS